MEPNRIELSRHPFSFLSIPCRPLQAAPIYGLSSRRALLSNHFRAFVYTFPNSSSLSLSTAAGEFTEFPGARLSDHFLSRYIPFQDQFSLWWEKMQGVDYHFFWAEFLPVWKEKEEEEEETVHVLTGRSIDWLTDSLLLVIVIFFVSPSTHQLSIVEPLQHQVRLRRSKPLGRR